MHLNDELNLRFSLAIDFFSELITGNHDFVFKFENGKLAQAQSPWTHYFHAISLGLTAADYLDRPSLRDRMAESFQELVDASTFSRGDSLFVIKDSKSHTVWSALAASVSLKLNKQEQARKYINSVLECVDDKISPFYPPDPDEKQTATNASEILVALLQAYDEFEDEEILGAAYLAAEKLVRQAVEYDPYTVWGLAKLYRMDGEPRYEKRVKRILSAFDSITTQAMTSLFASAALRAFASSISIHEQQQDEKYLSQLISLQVDPKQDYKLPETFHGAFVSSLHSNEVRLDYVVSSAIALLNYMELQSSRDITPM